MFIFCAVAVAVDVVVVVGHKSILIMSGRNVLNEKYTNAVVVAVDVAHLSLLIICSFPISP